jgi:hypothetical protein
MVDCLISKVLVKEPAEKRVLFLSRGQLIKKAKIFRTIGRIVSTQKNPALSEAQKMVGSFFMKKLCPKRMRIIE